MNGYQEEVTMTGMGWRPEKRVVAHGIPNPPSRNQRQRRRDHRRTRPHGWKGGAR